MKYSALKAMQAALEKWVSLCDGADLVACVHYDAGTKAHC